MVGVGGRDVEMYIHMYRNVPPCQSRGTSSPLFPSPLLSLFWCMMNTHDDDDALSPPSPTRYVPPALPRVDARRIRPQRTFAKRRIHRRCHRCHHQHHHLIQKRRVFDFSEEAEAGASTSSGHLHALFIVLLLSAVCLACPL